MDYLSPDPTFDAKRQTIRDSLDQIVSKIHAALTEAGLHYPIYVSVPSSGTSLLTIVTPLDPTDCEWDRISQIACDIVAKQTGAERMASRPIACAMAGAKMGSAEVVSDEA
jgi:hypothetical protein